MAVLGVPAVVMVGGGSRLGSVLMVWMGHGRVQEQQLKTCAQHNGKAKTA